MQLLQNGKQQWIDANGAPLANGTVGYYVPATLTPKTTYQDQGGTIPNANPITLDSRGQAIVWGTGTYRQIVKDASGVTIWDQTVSDTTSDIQSGTLTWLTSVAGNDTIAASATPAITAYVPGQTFRFVAAGANATNAVTLNINGLGAKSVTKFGALALSKGAIQSGAVIEVTYDGAQFQLTGVFPAQGTYAVRGLTGNNNATTPASKMDFAADLVELRNATTGEVVSIANTGTITCDTGLAGPALNGRDQAAAFPNNSWVHFYWVWNGQTLGTICSLTAPPAGPALLAGYAQWGYIGAVSTVGSTLNNVVQRGKTIFYASAQTVLSGGSATTQTAVPTASFVPPNASTVKVRVDFYGTTDGSGNLNMTGYVRHTAGSDYYRTDTGPIGGLALSTLQRVSGGTVIDIPNVSQNFYYLCSVGSGSSPSMNASVQAYTVPNGA